jgi:hypothetical protein
MRIFGEIETPELMASLAKLQAEIAKIPKSKLPVIKPNIVERAYGRYYGEPPVPDIQLFAEKEVDRGLMMITRCIFREDRIGRHPLEDRLEEAFVSLRFSEKRKEDLSSRIEHFNTSILWNTSSADRSLYATYFELIRVALYSLYASELAGLNVNMKRLNFQVGLLHDIGKVWAFNIGNCQKVWPQYKAEMREHPSAGASSVRELGIDIPAAIERTHLFEREPYPSEFTTVETDRAIMAAKIVAILDYYDSASTRANNRIPLHPLLRVLGKELPTKSTIKTLLIEERGKIDFSREREYFGFPFKDGEEFIEALYSARILGRDPYNPFPKAGFKPLS